MTDEAARRIALLEATLREMLRLTSACATSPTSVPLEDALDGQLLREWRKMERRARSLVGVP